MSNDQDWVSDPAFKKSKVDDSSDWVSDPTFKSDAFSSEEKKEENPGFSARAALEGFGKGIPVIGSYLDNIKAAAEPLVYKAMNLIDGQNIEPDDYVTARDKYAKESKELQEKYPKSFYGGMATGAIASTPLVPGLGGATAGARIANAAKTGAAIGALSNPGDTEGEISGLQLGDRAKNAGIGAGVGAAFQGGIEGVSKGLNFGKEYFKNLAEEKAVKAAGAMKRDFDALSRKGKVSEIGRTLLDEDIVTPLARPKDIQSRIQGKISGSMDDLSSYIDEADNIIQSNPTLEDASPEVINSVMKGQIKTSDIKNSLIDDLRKQFKGVPESELQPALSKVETWFGNQPEHMTAKQLQELKVGLNNFLRKSDFYKDMPGISKEGLLAVRRGTKEAIEKKGDAAAEILGDKTGFIKNTNKKLGNLLEIEDLAADRIARDASNRSISLTDTIAGGAGGIAGASVGGPIGLLGGLATAGANKVGRMYGNSLMATGFDKIASALKANSPALEKLSRTNGPAFSQLVQRLAMNPKFQEKELPMMPGVPDETPIQLPNVQKEDERIKEEAFLNSIKNPKTREYMRKRLDEMRSSEAQ